MAEHGGTAPQSVLGPGMTWIGILADERLVTIEFDDPYWWMTMTPAEARQMADLLRVKADEVERLPGGPEPPGGETKGRRA